MGLRREKKEEANHFYIYLDSVPRTSHVRSSQRQEFQRHIWGLIFIVDYFPSCMFPLFITSDLHKSLHMQTWVGGTLGEHKNWSTSAQHGTTECWEKSDNSMEDKIQVGDWAFCRNRWFTTGHRSSCWLPQKASNILKEMMWFLPFLR